MKDEEFNRTASVLAFLAKYMSDIHEMYPAKEDRKIREQLLQPYRDCCVKMHYERIRLVVGDKGRIRLNREN